MSASTIKQKLDSRAKRAFHTRKRLEGSTAKPRLSVYRSLNHIYAQVIDDSTGKTLVAASTLSPELKDGKGKKSEKAKEVGKLVAKKAVEAKLETVVFDRNGFHYHGRIAAVAEGAREGGLKF
jgi:large subunit ribosomal protein L18